MYCILVLTLVVRLVLWPLQTKANQTMRKTALLGPKMQELRENYKDDPTRMNQEVMNFTTIRYQSRGGSCRMAIQIPIFFGLSMTGAGGGIAKREVSLVQDLSQPTR